MDDESLRFQLVRLVSLDARPELNGLLGSALASNETSGRWRVVVGAGRKFDLKRANLTNAGVKNDAAQRAHLAASFGVLSYVGPAPSVAALQMATVAELAAALEWCGYDENLTMVCMKIYATWDAATPGPERVGTDPRRWDDV